MPESGTTLTSTYLAPASPFTSSVSPLHETNFQLSDTGTFTVSASSQTSSFSASVRETAIEELTFYLEGDIDCVEELAEKRITGPVRFNPNYGRMASPTGVI